MEPTDSTNQQAAPDASAASACSAVWRIITVRWNHDRSKGKETNEYVVAQGIEQVWDYLKFDRADEGVEIRAVLQEANVTRILSQNSRDTAP